MSGNLFKELASNVSGRVYVYSRCGYLVGVLFWSNLVKIGLLYFTYLMAKDVIH